MTTLHVTLDELAATPYGGLSRYAGELTRALLAVAERPEQIDTASARTRFVFFSAALPALAGAILSIAFRVPREWIEVVLLPAWVAILGIAWMQAGAWRIEDVHAGGSRSSVTVPLVAVVMLLLVFQLVLRPGIAFY